jgi:post-segregation antitoxin (ccd killing protein)
MARVNVYLPDELVAEWREAGLNLSMVTRIAVHRELGRWRTRGWLARVALERPGRITHEAALAALRGADSAEADR